MLFPQGWLSSTLIFCLLCCFNRVFKKYLVPNVSIYTSSGSSITLVIIFLNSSTFLMPISLVISRCFRKMCLRTVSETTSINAVLTTPSGWNNGFTEDYFPYVFLNHSTVLLIPSSTGTVSLKPRSLLAFEESGVLILVVKGSASL